MIEKSTPVNIQVEVAARRANIINSVITDGLKSAETLTQEGKSYFGSFDRDPIELISARFLLPPHDYRSAAVFSKRLKQILYGGSTSVLPVMAERQIRDNPIDKVYDASSWKDPTRIDHGTKKFWNRG